MAELEQLMKSLDSIEQKMASVPSKAELEELSKAQVKLAQQLIDVQQQMKVRLEACDGSRKSIGEQSITTDQVKAFVEGSTVRATWTVKAEAPMLTSTTAPGDVIPPYRKPGIIPLEYRALTVESFLPSITVTSNSVAYTREKEFTNNAGHVPEGQKAKLSSIVLEQKTAPISPYGHAAQISRDLLSDLPALQAYINVRMLYGVDLVVEDAIVNGTGANNTMTGLFHGGNYEDHGSKLADLPNLPNLVDLIGYAGLKVSENSYRPSIVLLNPFDCFQITNAKDTTGRYLFETPLSESVTHIRGLYVVKTQAVAKGKFLVMDPFSLGTIYNRAGIEFELSTVAGDNLLTNMVTIVARRRLGFGVERPKASIGGDLVVPAS